MPKETTTKNPSIILAPMAGITDLPFRVVCKELGADILYSEMVSASGLSYNNKTQSLALVNSCPQDFPLFVQLFGSDPKSFANAVKLIDGLPKRSSLGKDSASPCRPEGIDLNFGCPVKKVIKQNSGCVLMKDPPLARRIITAVLENTSLPVSIKIRAGIEKIDALAFLEEVKKLDWKTVIVHGRTFKEGFSGEIDFELIKKIKQAHPGKIVIANGGINSPEEAKNVLEKTGADGVAIARGVLGNPWLFSQIKQFLKTGKYNLPSFEEKKKVALHHADLAKKLLGEKSIFEFRKHLGWYFRGIPQAKKTRMKLLEASSFEEIGSLVQKCSN